MAAKEKSEAPAAALAPENAGGAPPKKKGKLVPLLLIAGLMGVEGVGVFFLTKMLSGGSLASAEGAQPEGDDHGSGHAAAPSGHADDKAAGAASAGPAEIDITECRPNNRATGKLITLKMRVSALVAGGDAEKARGLVESNKARINDRVNVVVRSAAPQELNEPGLETIKRRLKQELARVLGDEKLILEVLIPEMIQSGSGL